MSDLDPGCTPARERVAIEIKRGLDRACESGEIVAPAGFETPPIVVERPQRPEHGDYATNVALRSAGNCECHPSRSPKRLPRT